MSTDTLPAKPAPKKKKRITTTKRKPPGDAIQFLAEINETATLQLQLEHVQAELNELVSATGLDLRERIETLTADIEARLEALHGYAHPHRAELFEKGKKTADTTLATFGFADNPAKFTRAADYTEEDCISALLKLGKSQFVRTVREVDKDGIKGSLRDSAAMEGNPDKPADWQPAITMADLRMCGLKLSQTERFWLEPRRAAGPENSKVTTP